MVVLNNEIYESFLEINKAFKRIIKFDSDRLGITMVQLKAIYTLAANPDISLGELAEKLRMTNSTASSLIERLVQIGLVERVIPPENRRVVSIHLTEKGKKTLNLFYSSNSMVIKKTNEVLELPEEEISELLRLHKLVLKKLTIEEE
ncbi:MarR family transcriptional regulator [Neobacillus niacini]|uniref:MarR family winged helix-turn-helix transcriptional regulator n=1 Tax=Neobacillus niacini TaxID=86668 RepID=UPI002856AF34|nr:MarR family transcriptional regulator [Neobacillus niacini]MDR6999179.1 DNA-binding MarR family transcriptional regulator [Neobacillus niacini]